MDYRNMRREELKAELERLQRDLADLEEAIGFNLIHTSAHISGRQVRKDEDCLDALREQIAVVRKFLDSSKV